LGRGGLVVAGFGWLAGWMGGGFEDGGCLEEIERRGMDRSQTTNQERKKRRKEKPRGRSKDGAGLRRSHATRAPAKSAGQTRRSNAGQTPVKRACPSSSLSVVVRDEKGTSSAAQYISRSRSYRSWGVAGGLYSRFGSLGVWGFRTQCLAGPVVQQLGGLHLQAWGACSVNG
jgi:hypothetical protein